MSRRRAPSGGSLGRVILGLLFLVVGAALALVGHRTGRLQLRAIGAGLAVFGLVTGLLSALG